jgi:hypothetical protein
MTMLSKSRYTATRGVPGSVTVTVYHLSPRLRTDRDSRRFRDLAAVSAANSVTSFEGAPAAKKSGPDPKVLIGIGAAVVVLIGVIVAAVLLTMNTKTGEDSVTHKPAEASATSAAQTDDPDPTETQTAGVGQEVRDGDFEFVIAGIERVDAIADPDLPELRKAAQGEYVVVKMTVTNVGAETQTFVASFKTISDGNTVYQSDDEAFVYLDNLLVALKPGDSVDTAAVFDVPKGTDVESIELHDTQFSDGVTVGL